MRAPSHGRLTPRSMSRCARFPWNPSRTPCLKAPGWEVWRSHGSGRWLMSRTRRRRHWGRVPGIGPQSASATHTEALAQQKRVRSQTRFRLNLDNKSTTDAEILRLLLRLRYAEPAVEQCVVRLRLWQSRLIPCGRRRSVRAAGCCASSRARQASGSASRTSTHRRHCLGPRARGFTGADHDAEPVDRRRSTFHQEPGHPTRSRGADGARGVRILSASQRHTDGKSSRGIQEPRELRSASCRRASSRSRRTVRCDGIPQNCCSSVSAPQSD